MEVNGSDFSAKNSVAIQFLMKESIVIRSMLTAVKSGMKLLGATTLGCVLAGVAAAQTIESAPNPLPLPPALKPTLEGPVASAPTPADANAVPIFDPMIKPASGCASCGSSAGANSYGCSNNNCVPGRYKCNVFDNSTVCGRFCCGLCQELCCPDPCYEPRWIAEANAAFFQDSPRPVTQTRIRWDSAFDYRNPDSAEFFWPRIGQKGPKTFTPALRYNELSLYQEIAANPAFSFFTEIPYLTVHPDIGPSGSGFGDINLGTKVVLLDRELLLITMQFRTFIPSGNFTAGAGTGHTSLEPALLMALKLGESTYLQTELAEWIPIGQTQGFGSTVFHYHFSLNHCLCRWGDCVRLIGTLELNGYNFQGEFTDANGNVIGLDGANYLNAGPGLRLQICDHIDFGFAAAFGFGSAHGPGEIYRAEFRYRF
jgi:hypothetical protein